MSTTEQKALAEIGRIRSHYGKEIICCNMPVPGDPGDGYLQPPDPPSCCQCPDEDVDDLLNTVEAALRRLSAENEALLADAQTYQHAREDLIAENMALRAQVEALRLDIARRESNRQELVEDIRRIEASNKEDRDRLELVRQHQGKDCWYWMDDGEDHLESMVHSLPVVIPAGRLRELLRAQVEALTALTEPAWDATKLAEMVLSDCGISSDHTRLLERVAGRIEVHVQDRIKRLQALTKPVYLVATGEVHEGQETYTRHDAPVPLADQEVLYTHPAPQALTRPVEFDDCSASATGKHSESWYVNNDCEHCKAGAGGAKLLMTAEPEVTRPAVPEFSRIAQRKLDELVADGFQVTGYAIQRGDTRGFIDSAGFVGWWTRPAVPVADAIRIAESIGVKEYGPNTRNWSFELSQLERFVRLLAAAPQPEVKAQFQQRVQPWLMECFGAMIAGDREERNHRFLEEALELVQACGCTAGEAHQLVDYTFGRPIGEPAQEVGGVMVTLAALCLANGLDMHANGETELTRISDPEMVKKIRAKQAAKPKYSPLPEAATQTEGGRQ